MLDAPRRRIELVESVPAANVEAAVEVFGDHFGDVARHALRGGVADKRGSLRAGVVDTDESSTGGSEPEST